MAKAKHPEIPDRRIADLLTSAWEGGSAYWARSEGTPYTNDGQLRIDPSITLTVRDENGEGAMYLLNRTAVERGVALLAHHPYVLARILNEEDDAADADVFLQLCVFGEVIYG